MPLKAAPSIPRRALARYYPVYLKLDGRLVTVVGGGTVAERKVRMLLECGARVRVVTLQATRRLRQLALKERIKLLLGPYETEHLADAFLVVASTNDRAVNQQVFADANARNIPCNVADAPELCSFIVPAVVSRGDLSIAISTNGKSPSFSKLIRERLESQFGPEYASYLKLLGSLRPRVKRLHPTAPEREEVWERLHTSGILEALRVGDKRRVREIVRACL